MLGDACLNNLQILKKKKKKVIFPYANIFNCEKGKEEITPV